MVNMLLKGKKKRIDSSVGESDDRMSPPDAKIKNLRKSRKQFVDNYIQVFFKTIVFS